VDGADCCLLILRLKAEANKLEKLANDLKNSGQRHVEGRIAALQARPSKALVSQHCSTEWQVVWCVLSLS
jgi:hypothetical protein